MYSKSLKNVLLCGMILSVTACSAVLNKKPLSADKLAAKEALYQSTNNNDALITMYRDGLKNKEDPLTRYKLSEIYYKKGDSNSSLLYLQPLLTNSGQLSERAKILQARNLNQLKRYQEALEVENSLLTTSPKNGEVYNLRGVTYALMGNPNKANEDINKAREYFLDDAVAVDNLAMLSIVNGDYRNAVSLLLPQYLNGVREQRLVHNLIFALIKNNDIDYAKDIIVKENINTSPDDLINALKKTERVSNNIAR